MKKLSLMFVLALMPLVLTGMGKKPVKVNERNHSKSRPYARTCDRQARSIELTGRDYVEYMKACERNYSVKAPPSRVVIPNERTLEKLRRAEEENRYREWRNSQGR